MTHGMGDALIHAFSEKLAAHTGLCFDELRWSELRRAIDALATLGNAVSVEAELQSWLSRPWSQADIELLAAHLCVGETYFFREPAILDLLERELLPELVSQRRASTKRLRLWSAGCSTGEEAYTLAIMLSRLIADVSDWDIVVVGTDIHPGSLARATEGIYGEWSFRGVPKAVRERYFDSLADERFAVKPGPRSLTRFCYANLMQAAQPGIDFDLVLCRNVLMYFEREQAAAAVQHLRDALSDGGLLLVGATEASGGLCEGFSEIRFESGVFHRKVPIEQQMPAAVQREAELPPALPPLVPQRKSPEPDTGLARALARCEAAIARDKCDAALHVHHAELLEEATQLHRAREALRRALFLDPTLTAAREAMERLTRKIGRHRGPRTQGLAA